MATLNKPSDELVIDLINTANNSTLTVENVIVGSPTAITDTGATLNTTVNLKARKNSGYVGNVDANYNRLTLGKLFKNINVYLDVHLPKTTTDLLAALNKRYGLQLSEDDIVPSAIPDNTNPVSDDDDASNDPQPVSHDIVANDTSLAFLGQVTVLIGALPQVGERLSKVVTVTDMEGLNYPDGDSDEKGQAYVYSYGVDCGAIAAWLGKRSVGETLEDTALANQLNIIVPEQWVDNTNAADYNTHGVEITYAGATASDPEGKANTDYQSVVKFKLSDDLCSNFTGELYLHYNAS